ncbi:MAG TPA: phosphotransferase family protein [Solirubrobacteraceae bacterium]|nr:phosphotransferase family protein [Solirubrobacteraceae bacterium]
MNDDPLGAVLRDRLGETLGHEVDVRELRRLTGGASHETWACELVDGARTEKLVVRRDIEDGLLEGDGAGEFALLRALHGIGLPVPRQWLHVPGLTVMERVPGTDARKVLAGPGHGLDPHALGLQLVDIQASLHGVDWHAHLAGTIAPAEDEVARWARVLDGSRVEPEPVLDAALSWLTAHPPRATEPRLVHGDFKANNVLVSPDGRATVIDWEMAHLGDPVEDLAWTLLWAAEADLVGGMLERDEYLQAYERASGNAVDPEALFFWELFALVKLAAIFLTGVRAGGAGLPTLMMLGRATPVLERRILARLRSALERDAA